MTIFKAARIAAFMTGGSMLLAATPSLAQAPRPNPQAQGQAAQPAPAPRKFNLSAAERAALVPLEQAVQAAQQQGQAGNWTAATALLAAAQAAARGNDARYLVAKFQYSIAVGTNNVEGQEQALTALAASPSATPQEVAEARRILPRIPHVRAEKAFNAGDFATAERIYRQILQTNPGDQLAQSNLRVTLGRTGNTAGSLQLLEEQIRTAEAGGQRAPEDLYQRAWQLSHRGGRRAEALTGLQRLLKAYPTAANWRRAFDVVRESVGEDNQLLVDVYRFARAANVMQPNEYVALAETVDQAGLPGETKAILDAAVASRQVQASQPAVARLLSTANRRIAEDRAGLAGQIQQARNASGGRQARLAGDALQGYGRYAEAAELYRLALTKGGEDANLVNTRLGASLALAGQRAQAETALRAVTGKRAEVAALWLAWLNRSPS